MRGGGMKQAGLRLVSLSNKACRYPIAGEGLHTLFCGEPKGEGRESYCEAHHKLCWVPPAEGRVKPIAWKHKVRAGNV